jgi:GDP-D-mannose dehydratase
VENIKGEVVPMPKHNTIKTYTKWICAKERKIYGMMMIMMIISIHEACMMRLLT